MHCNCFAFAGGRQEACKLVAKKAALAQDGHYTIFGELVSGWSVAEQINALSRGRPDNTANADAGAQIVDAGQLQR